MAKEVKKTNEVKKEIPKKAAPKKETVKKSAPEKGVDKNVVVGKYKIECVYGDLYQFYLFANNGQLLYESREYATKKSCIQGIDTFKKNLQDSQTTMRVDMDKNKRYKFIIKNRNSIYVGETYDTQARAESSAESVRRFGLISPIVD